MAAVHPQTVQNSLQDYRQQQNQNIPHARRHFAPAPAKAQPNQQHTDPFYGHEPLARLCARFITHLFACPEAPPVQTPVTHGKLPYFIAYALHRTKLHASVTFAALVLLQRLKARFPTARGSSGHRLFISAFMIASKVICDDTYSNKSWGIVAQGMFHLREINQMEREMCSYLEWELNVEPQCLREFEKMVRHDFAGPGPYPTYTLTVTSSKATNTFAHAAVITPPNTSTSPIPSFGQHQPQQPPPPAPLQVKPHPQSQPTPPNKPFAYPKPRHPPQQYMTSPDSPQTPSPSHSTTTSPASSASPATPLSSDDLNIKIVGSPTGTPVFALRKGMTPSSGLKGKIFAYAAPSVW